MARGIFTSITGKLERALRNGERVHLSIEEVRALYSSDAGQWVVLAARRELIEATPTEPLLPDPSQRGDAPNPPAEPLTALIEDAAERRCAQVVAELRRKGRKKSSQNSLSL